MNPLKRWLLGLDKVTFTAEDVAMMRDSMPNARDMNDRFGRLANAVGLVSVPFLFVPRERYSQSKVNANLDAIHDAIQRRGQ